MAASVLERGGGEKALAELRAQADGAQAALLEAGARVETARTAEREALQKRQELGTAQALQEDRHQKLEESLALLTAEARTFAQREETLQARLDELIKHQAGKRRPSTPLRSPAGGPGAPAGPGGALEEAEAAKRPSRPTSTAAGRARDGEAGLEHYAATAGPWRAR